MPYEGSFDASQFDPVQSMGSHPVGVFEAIVSNTSIEPTKNGQGGLFKVDFSTPAGSIAKRYNLWNQEPKAVEIAHKELSALCHATGVFKLDFRNDGAALRNARLKIDVQYQKGHEPSAEKPQGGYTEIRKVLDPNGNEPGRAPAGAPKQQEAAPMQQNPQGGWGTKPAEAPATQAATGWGAQSTSNGDKPATPWQPSGAAPSTSPPWAR